MTRSPGGSGLRTGDGPPDRGRPRLTALVCSFTCERWADLCAALDSLQRQTYPPDEIVLVCDHNPALLERARCAFPGVTCVPNTGPKGLSGARNTGLEVAKGDVVAFLDDDAVAAPDWAERLLDAYSDGAVFGVGGAVEPAWRTPRPRWFPDEFLWVIGCSYTGQPRVRTEIRNPIGANMSFRREVFAAVGGFDPTMGRLREDAAGCEETELAIRARRSGAGARFLAEPGARCRHAVPADRATRRYFRRRCMAEGRSKALLSRLAGTEQALSTERAYLRRTLPVGLARGLREALSGDLGGAARAWTIVEGTALTAAGYLLTRARLARSTGAGTCARAAAPSLTG